MSRATELPRTAVPQGVASFLPDIAARKRQLEDRALTTLRQWGYREVVPPLFEYLEVLANGLVPETVARGYKVEDRQDGRLMVLRPDVTAQVARMAAARHDDPTAHHRYGYASNVFSHVEAHRGRPREVFQVGAELLGPSGVAADVELLSLLIATLRGAGLTEFTVAIGQSSFFHAILDGLELTESAARELTQAVRRKDATSIRLLLGQADIDAARVDTVAEIPFLIGGSEVLDRARELTRCTDALTALAHLEAVMDGLAAQGLSDFLLVDLGEIRDLSYYTGLVFEVLVPSMGVELGGGGRYDDLMGSFGHPMPAIGFALDVERLMEALTRAGSAPAPEAVDYVLSGTPEAVQPTALALRTAGLNIVVALPDEATDRPRLRAAGDGLYRVAGDGSEVTVNMDDLLAESGR